MNAPIRSYCRFGLVLATVSTGFVGCGTTTKPEPMPAVVEPKFTGLVIEQGPSSLGAEPRKESVTCLILHHTAGSLPSSLEILQGKDPKHKVGVHYVVTDEPKPRVIRMVPENMSAFHAGKSAWGKINGLNQHSIGIEIINYDGNVYPYSEAQAEIIFALCDEITGRSLDYTLSDQARIGDHMWWVSDLDAFKADYPEWELTFGIEDVLRDIHDSNAEKWLAEVEAR